MQAAPEGYQPYPTRRYADCKVTLCGASWTEADALRPESALYPVADRMAEEYDTEDLSDYILRELDTSFAGIEHIWATTEPYEVPDEGVAAFPDELSEREVIGYWGDSAQLNGNIRMSNCITFAVDAPTARKNIIHAVFDEAAGVYPTLLKVRLTATDETMYEKTIGCDSAVVNADFTDYGSFAVQKVEIWPLEMNEEKRFFRLAAAGFGYLRRFDKDTMETVSLMQEIDPTGDSIPSWECDATLYDPSYSVFEGVGIWGHMTKGESLVAARLGTGSERAAVHLFPMGVLMFDSATQSNSSVKLVAYDPLYYLTEAMNKGQFASDELKNLVDATLEESEYPWVPIEYVNAGSTVTAKRLVTCRTDYNTSGRETLRQLVQAAHNSISWSVNNRAVVTTVETYPDQDVRITLDDMEAVPELTENQRITKVKVTTRGVTRAKTADQNIFEDDVEKGSDWVEFSAPVKNPSGVTCTGGKIQPYFKGGIVTVSSDKEVTITDTGGTYKEHKRTRSYKIPNAKTCVHTCTNYCLLPGYSTYTLPWMKWYVDACRFQRWEIKAKTRGDPTLVPGDGVYMEIHKGLFMPVCILKQTFTFNGILACELEGGVIDNVAVAETESD